MESNASHFGILSEILYLFNKTTIMKIGKTILSIQFTLSPDYILYPLGRCGLLIINSNRVVFAYLHERHLSLDLQQRCQ